MTWETIKMTCKQPWFLMCFAFSVESIIFLKAYFKFRKIQLHFITSILWIMGCMLDRPSLMIHVSTYMPFSTYHHINAVIIGHFMNLMFINLLFTLLKNNFTSNWFAAGFVCQYTFLSNIPRSIFHPIC